MKPIHNKGQLTIEAFKDENGYPINLLRDEENNCWHGVFPAIQFGQRRLLDAAFLIEEEKIHVTANAQVGGISLTFDYDHANNTFESDEEINIIHIVTDQIHTLTDFSMTVDGQISASLANDQLSDNSEKRIRLQYDETSDTWASDLLDAINYGLCFFKQATIYLNDYDFVLQGIARFSDNIIEYSFGKTENKEIFFRTTDVNWKVGNYEFEFANIRFYASGQLEASGQLNIYNQRSDFIYNNGKMRGTAEIIKKYPAPEKGCFETNRFYQLNLLHEISIDIFNSKKMQIKTMVKVTNPFVVKLNNKGTNGSSETVLLQKDHEDGKYKADVQQQTVMYKGLAKNGFMSEYHYEESKRYMFDPESEILTVGTKFLQGHGKLFYRRVYNYYYKNFEQYSKVKGFWPFRRLEYQFYYQMISQLGK